MAATPAPSLLLTEAPAIAGILTTIIFFVFDPTLLAHLENHLLTVALFLWLFVTMMWCSFGVVRHAEAVAEKLGEPYGTLVLTGSVIVIEVALLASIMLHAPTIRRSLAIPCSPR